MSTNIQYPDVEANGDGYLEGYSEVSYADAQSLAEAPNVNSDYPILDVGQGKDSTPSWSIQRSFVYFEVEGQIIEDAISVGAVTAARIRVCSQVYDLTAGWNLVVQSGMPTYPHTTLAAGDYNKTHYGSTIGSVPLAASNFETTETYFDLEFNSTGLQWIIDNAPGMLRFCIRNSKDVAGTEPVESTWEFVGLYAEYEGDYQDYRPILEITIAAPTKAIDPDPGDTETDVPLNQQLSWTAGDYTNYHYVYFGKTSPPTYKTKLAIGVTTYDPGTLDPDTIYYWRINEEGANETTTGDIWSFTTEAAPVSGMLGSTERGIERGIERGVCV